MAERNEEQGDVHDQKDLKEEKNRARFSSRYYSKRTRRSVCACISIFLLVIGVVALTLWLVYRPIDPQFTVVGAAIYDLNMSSLPLLSTTMQFTIVTRNPNRRVSIYYDRLTVFVSYRNQQITSQVILPPLAHEKRSTVAMSPTTQPTQQPLHCAALLRRKVYSSPLHLRRKCVMEFVIRKDKGTQM
ncbi:hypothetical protein Csa_011664 [Cucumis sativus]|nr:hypothetical protein Csa_011664 [Cucumis sativus]